MALSSQNPAYAPLPIYSLKSESRKSKSLEGIKVKTRRLFWWAVFILYAVLIFYWSSRPIPEEAPLPRFAGSDKLLHWAEYLLFGLLAFKAFAPHTQTQLFAVLLIVLLYAASDEVHHLFVPQREASIFDWGADALGIFTALGLRWKLAAHFRA